MMLTPFDDMLMLRYFCYGHIILPLTIDFSLHTPFHGVSAITPFFSFTLRLFHFRYAYAFLRHMPPLRYCYVLPYADVAAFSLMPLSLLLIADYFAFHYAYAIITPLIVMPLMMLIFTMLIYEKAQCFLHAPPMLMPLFSAAAITLPFSSLRHFTLRHILITLMLMLIITRTPFRFSPLFYYAAYATPLIISLLVCWRDGRRLLRDAICRALRAAATALC